jgi:type VI secretion system protein ImpA
MIELEELLKPISAEQPCGADISYDPKFLELDALIAGKAETQFSAGEEPDWKAVREACVGLLRRSKNLRVATTLCLALVKLEGATGLRDGLMLLKGLLERYWPDVYPKLDPEEKNDPLERVNILSALSTPRGTFGDPMRFLQRLRQMPLANSPQMGRFSLADMSGGEEKSSPSAGQINAAFRDTNPGELAATGQAIAESISLAKAIDTFLTETISANRAPNMDALLAVLAEIQKTLSPHLPKGAGELLSEGGTGNSTQPGAERNPGTGAIQSRQDVVRALDRICEYYARTEPSSPVPFLLRRAQRMVEMDFVQIIDELTPAARTQLETIVGVKSPDQTVSPPN